MFAKLASWCSRLILKKIGSADLHSRAHHDEVYVTDYCAASLSSLEVHGGEVMVVVVVRG